MRTRKEIRQERGETWEQMKSMLDKAEEEKRDLDAQEQERYDAMNADLDKLDNEEKRLDRREELEGRMREVPSEDPNADPPNDSRGDPGGSSTPEQREAFRKYLRSGMRALSPEETRALQAGADDEGGYLVPPQEFINELLKAVDNAVYIRQWARIERLSMAESLGVPSLDTDPNDADWTSELATGNEDTAMRFGKRELRPHPLAKRIKVSKKLMRQSGIEGIVRDRIAYKFGITEEKAFLTGSGAQQPLGVFTASSDGISTGRDAVVGSTSAITGDGLIEVKHTLKGQYWRNARWLFHRDAIKQIRQLKSSDNQYIWQPGLSQDLPNSILDTPYFMSEHVPNTFTTGLYVGIIGDFSFYWIAEALNFELQRLTELYAESNQIGFIGRQELDGMPVLEEAFVRATLA